MTEEQRSDYDRRRAAMLEKKDKAERWGRQLKEELQRAKREFARGGRPRSPEWLQRREVMLTRLQTEAQGWQRELSKLKAEYAAACRADQEGPRINLAHFLMEVIKETLPQKKALLMIATAKDRLQSYHAQQAAND